MSNIAITLDGTPINISSFVEPRFSTNGFLLEFKYQSENSNNELITYKYFYSSVLNRGERKYSTTNLPSAYYNEEKALLYISSRASSFLNPTTRPTYKQMLELYRFDKNFTRFIAKENDVVKIDINDYTEHNVIQEELLAEFKVKKNEDGSIKKYLFKGKRKIKIPLYGEDGYISYNINVDNNWINSSDSIKKSAGYFYKKNFSDKLTNYIFDKEEKIELDRYVSLISLHIIHINKESFPILLNGLTASDPNKATLETIINEIKKSFGNDSNENTVPYTSYLPEALNIEVYRQKYAIIKNFYKNIYYNQLAIPNKTAQERIELLIRILPSATMSLVPLAQRVNLIKEYAEGKIPEEEEDLILRIIESVQFNEATEFLTALIHQDNVKMKSNGVETLFESMYRKIQDATLGLGKDNRKALMNKLYIIWYVSNFNPSNNNSNFDYTYTENPTTSSNYDYEQNPTTAQVATNEKIFEYQETFANNPVNIDYNSEKLFGFYIDNMQFSFKNYTINVKEEQVTGGFYGANAYHETKEYISIGQYSMYQAISLLDYKEEDIAVRIPAIALDGNSNTANNAILPLFFLKYIDDAGDKEDLWTGVGLTLDVALTFTGIGNLTKLRHLRHVSKFGKYLMKPSAFTNAEKIFLIQSAIKGGQGIAGAIELTSSFASIFLTYYTDGCSVYKNHVKDNINDTTPPENLKTIPEQPANPDYEFCKAMDQFLFWLQIGSGGFDLLAGVMLRKQAKKLKDLGYPAHWEPSFVAKLDDLANDVTKYNNFISSLPDAYRPAITAKLESLGNDAKYAFSDDFIEVPANSPVWQQLANNTEAITNWNNLRNVGLKNTERVNINLLKDTELSNKLVIFYQEVPLKQVLNTLKLEQKIKFINKFGNLTPLPNPNFIKVWQKLDNLEEGKRLDIFNNKQTIENLENFVDDVDYKNSNLLDSFLYEANHKDRGANIRALVQEKPTDLQDFLRPILKDPNYSFANKEIIDPRWALWRKTQFFKYWSSIGKKFENFIVGGLAKRTSAIYADIQRRINNLGINKNLDEYELFTQVQLKYNTNGDYFVTDQLFVKYEYDVLADEEIITDIIVIENKLQGATNLSTRQLEALTTSHNSGFDGFKVRNAPKVKESLYTEDLYIDNLSDDLLNFNGAPTFLKISDKDKGDVIDNLEILTPQ